MRNLIKSFYKKFVSAMMLLLLTSSVSYAFDMDAALAIYQEEQNQQSQAPQQHTREYYQQRWLEQQNKTAPQEAAQHEASYQKGQYTQATPEADDLFLAATNGNNTQIGKLLAQGLDVNVSNAEHETALHMAAARGHYSTVIYLINNGAYPMARTVKNWIPLHHAVRFRHYNIANFLVKRGSPVDERTSDGLSAVDMARNLNDYRLLALLGAR